MYASLWTKEVKGQKKKMTLAVFLPISSCQHNGTKRFKVTRSNFAKKKKNSIRQTENERMRYKQVYFGNL